MRCLNWQIIAASHCFQKRHFLNWSFQKMKPFHFRFVQILKFCLDWWFLNSDLKFRKNLALLTLKHLRLDRYAKNASQNFFHFFSKNRIIQILFLFFSSFLVWRFEFGNYCTLLKRPIKFYKKLLRDSKDVHNFIRCL